MQRSDLLSNATVVAYLGSMEVTQNDLVDDQAPNQEQADEPMHEGEEDDFSWRAGSLSSRHPNEKKKERDVSYVRATCSGYIS